MQDNKLLKYEGGVVKKVSNAISIANKLLVINEPQLIPYRKKNNWGFCTPDKKIVIDCIFDDAYIYCEGFAKVKLNGKWGFIEIKGNFITECIFEECGEFDEGLAEVKLNDKWGFINTKGAIDKKLILLCK